MRQTGEQRSEFSFLLQSTQLTPSLTHVTSMTTGAQQALRRTMEIYSNTTRFCLACNQSNKIIDPIQSRCAILRYTKLSDEEVMKRLLEICDLEKVRQTLRTDRLPKYHD